MLTLPSFAVGSLSASVAGGSGVISTLPNFKSKVAAVKAGSTNARAVWAMVGDSVTAGWGSAGTGGNTGSSPGAAGVYLRTKGLPAEIAKALVAAGYPARSDGFFGTGRTTNDTTAEAVSANPNVTLGSDWSIYTSFPSAGGPFYKAGTTTAMTFTPSLAADRFDLYYVQNSGFGTFTVTDASGTLATINASSGSSPSVAKATITRTVASTGPISITATAEDYVLGILPWNSTSPAIEVVNMGWAGSKASDWITVNYGFEPFSVLKVLPADLLSFELGANDVSAGVTASTYSSNMQSLINYAKVGGPSADVLLVKCHTAVAPFAGNDIGPYLSTIDALAAQYGQSPALDFYHNANITTADRYDGIHLVNSGYAKEAALAAAFVQAQL